MPLYEFQLESGEVVEEFFHMSDAPEIGSYVVLETHDMQTGRRIVTAGSTQAQVKDYFHVAHSLHRDNPHRPLLNEDGSKRYPRCDNAGRPVFESKREIDEFKARHDYAYDG